jgi:diguanylate cyclase (GGDEF)-like protein
MENTKSGKAEVSDRELFQQGLAELHRVVRNSWASTLAQIAMLMTIFAVPTLAPKMRAQGSEQTIIEGLLILLAILQVLDVDRHFRTKTLREQLAKQSQYAARRADTLYDLAILDPLTGLHNRRFAEERLNEEIARAERTDDPLALLLIDLDYFKEINDKFGHAAGDLALKEFSRKLRRAIRSCDVPARLGGDEFLVMLPECPRDKVDIILARIGNPEIRVNGQVISVCYSVGRAHYQVCDTKQTMLERADRNLYVEKANRRGNSAAQGQGSPSVPGQGLGYARPLTVEISRSSG